MRGSRKRGTRRILSALAALVVGSALVLGGPAVAVGASTSTRSRAVSRTSEHPNIVFVLTDDLSWNLINQRFAPHIMQLARRGESF
jgi:N-acetylglucosamine-6-sulfatase